MKNSPAPAYPMYCSIREAAFGAGRFGEETFRKEVCEVYDLLIGRGLGRNLAIKKTREILKGANYPFVTYDTVVTRLRVSGRFKKNVPGQK